MAILFKGRNELQERVTAGKKFRSKLITVGIYTTIAFIISLVSVAIFFNAVTLIIMGFVASCGIFVMFFISFTYKRTDIMGLAGEKRALELLSELEDSYRLFYSCNIAATGDTRPAQIDVIVCGPTGLYIIEIKNRNQHITGCYTDRQWVQHKIGIQGGRYQSEFYSPIKQIKTHIYKLSNFLKAENARVYISPIVYFSNPEATLDVDGGGVSVFEYNNRYAMLDYIGSGHKLDKTQQDKICDSLMKLL